MALIHNDIHPNAVQLFFFVRHDATVHSYMEYSFDDGVS